MFANFPTITSATYAESESIWTWTKPSAGVCSCVQSAWLLQLPAAWCRSEGHAQAPKSAELSCQGGHQGWSLGT